MNVRTNEYTFGALYKWVVKRVHLEKYEKSQSMAPLIRFSVPFGRFLYTTIYERRAFFEHGERS